MGQLSVGEVKLIRDALKMAASRHRVCANAIKNGTRIGTVAAEATHEEKAIKMEKLRERLLDQPTFGRPTSQRFGSSADARAIGQSFNRREKA